MLRTDKEFANIPHGEISDDELLNNQSGITGQMHRLNRIMASRLRQSLVEQSDKLVASIEEFGKTSRTLSKRVITLNWLLVALTFILVIDVLIRWWSGH